MIHHHDFFTGFMPIFLLLLSLLLSTSLSEDDVRCLREVRNSFTDPDGKLNSWNFVNNSVGYICGFVGVSCWNDPENRILGLELRDFGLTGKIPDSIQFCHSIQILNLSGNSLSDSIPTQICSWLPYLVTLDLSRNKLTGPIPENLANCTYLNILSLDDNKLSGNIPYQVLNLQRLEKFSVANNDLSGRVPSFKCDLLNADFSGNSGLRGSPLGKCDRLSKKSLAIIIAAGFCGAACSLLLSFCWWRWCFTKSSKRRGGR